MGTGCRWTGAGACSSRVDGSVACPADSGACVRALRRKQGEYGYGAHADEPWSLQAYQKRVYAIRDVYATELRGTGIDNPGWDDAVCGVLASLARLVGKGATHVPQVNSYHSARLFT